MARRLRLWSGLVLFVFVGTHLLNHALGVISLGAAETGRLVFMAVWRNPVGTVLLYSALITHVVLVLMALFQARHLRLPRWEIVRLAGEYVEPEPSHDDLLALANAVREAGRPRLGEPPVPGTSRRVDEADTGAIETARRGHLRVLRDG